LSRVEKDIGGAVVARSWGDDRPTRSGDAERGAAGGWSSEHGKGSASAGVVVDGPAGWCFSHLGPAQHPAQCFPAFGQEGRPPGGTSFNTWWKAPGPTSRLNVGRCGLGKHAARRPKFERGGRVSRGGPTPGNGTAVPERYRHRIQSLASCVATTYSKVGWGDRRGRDPPWWLHTGGRRSRRFGALWAARDGAGISGASALSGTDAIVHKNRSPPSGAGPGRGRGRGPGQGLRDRGAALPGREFGSRDPSAGCEGPGPPRIATGPVPNIPPPPNGVLRRRAVRKSIQRPPVQQMWGELRGTYCEFHTNVPQQTRASLGGGASLAGKSQRGGGGGDMGHARWCRATRDARGSNNGRNQDPEGRVRNRIKRVGDRFLMVSHGAESVRLVGPRLFPSSADTIRAFPQAGGQRWEQVR